MTCIGGSNIVTQLVLFEMNKMRMEETSILTFLTVFLLILLYFNPNLGAQSFGIGDGDGDGPNTIRCKDRERLALLLFKKGIYDNYGRLSSWGDGDEKKECCNWEGVRCSNRTGHVLALDLPGDYDKSHYLRGTISPSLMELNHMKYLDLSENIFNGSIPLQLGNLSSLQYLNLSNNYLLEVGNLKWLSNLPNLKHLDLSEINLYEVNDWFEIIGRLSKLSTLALTSCGLSPPTLSSVSHINASSSLVSVQLDSNFHLTSSIFPWLFNSSSSLLHLNLADNHLEHEIPKSFGNLCYLQTLDLSRNNLKGELAFIHNLSSCARFSTKSLKLSGNRFTGQLPDFSIFPSLKVLDLAYNQLNGDLTKSIQNLFDLEILDVSSNNLQGVISEPILSNFSKLRILGLSSKSLALELNFNWVPPFQLEILNLRACNLGGPKFPNWLQTLKNLSYIDISSAGIYDEIPTWFWKLINTSDMSYMNFSNNHIHGVLPNLSLKIESTIDLSSNLFHGRLPTIQNFNFLDLSNNKFSGSILPLCDSSFPLYGILDLSNNQLSGEISDYCLSNLTSLIVLNLANNNLSGKIPNSSSSMRNRLDTLDLHNNNFSGELPSCMGTWNSLRFFDLGDNNFSGKFPAWIGQNLTDLKILILRSNKFHGRIPSSLCQLKDLNILDLSHNNMSGVIPQCLNNFTAMARNANLSEIIKVGVTYYGYSDITADPNSWSYINKATVVWKGRADEYVRNLVLLRVIDLSSNRLTGNFPDQILNLTGLVSLNLSRNSLSGRLPRDIGQLNELESLDLSRNQFSGEIPSSMSDLEFLSHLDLSYNKLSGKIPPGTQLQGFNASVYAGNEALCGPPLTPNCSSEDPPTHGTPSNETSEDEIRKWFYVGLGSGFVAGFWGFCGVLVFNRAWRYAYFSALNKSFDWLLLKVALLRVRLSQRSQI